MSDILDLEIKQEMFNHSKTIEANLEKNYENIIEIQNTIENDINTLQYIIKKIIGEIQENSIQSFDLKYEYDMLKISKNYIFHNELNFERMKFEIYCTRTINTLNRSKVLNMIYDANFLYNLLNEIDSMKFNSEGA